MPSHPYSPAESMQVVAYMRTAAAKPSPATARAAAPVSDATQAARGKSIVEGKGSCLGCHRIRGTGSGSAQTITAYGRVQPQATPPADTYEDTVQITVTY